MRLVVFGFGSFVRTSTPLGRSSKTLNSPTQTPLVIHIYEGDVNISELRAANIKATRQVIEDYEKLFVNRGLFGDDPVGPLNELHEDCGTAEFCTPTAQVCFRDPTGPGTGSSSKNGNVFSHDLLAHFGEGRPTDRKHRLRGNIAHQVRGFARKEDLDLVTSVG